MDADESMVKQALDDIRKLEESGAGLPLIFRPHEALMLLSLLQLALRHPRVSEQSNVFQFATVLAHDIESRLCKTPALVEMARRGWNPEYDTKAF